MNPWEETREKIEGWSYPLESYFLPGWLIKDLFSAVLVDPAYLEDEKTYCLKEIGSLDTFMKLLVSLKDMNINLDNQKAIK